MNYYRKRSCKISTSVIMRYIVINTILVMGIFSFLGCRSQDEPAGWSKRKTDKWFNDGEWLHGLEAVPDPSVNRKALAVAYFKNQGKWKAAFSFLRRRDLSDLPAGRHEIDGDNVYAMVNEYITKDPENAQFEAHRKYIDIQYMLAGRELIGLAPLNAKSVVTSQFDAANDYELFSVRESVTLKASPGKFFVFFPEDAHCPGLKDGVNSPVRKIVLKVKVD
jgi:YhcH/YjgK/YiaL family protein